MMDSTWKAFQRQTYMVVMMCVLGSAAAVAQTNSPPDGVVDVDITPSHLLNSFNPDQALGSSMDVLSRSGIDQVYTPHIIEESLSADGARFLTETIPNCVKRHGTGIPKVPGAIPPIRADTLLVARN